MPDYGAPQAGGMGQMVQMIAALAEMQDRRKRLAMDEHQMSVQQEQFAQTLGFNKESERYKNASKLIDLATHGGAEGVTALYQLGKAMGLDENQAQQISHVGMDAGSALQRIQAKQGQFNLDQQQGGLDSFGSPNATPQQTAQQAAYLNQQAGGPGALGQMGNGQLIAQLAAGALGQINPQSKTFDQDMAQRASQAYLVQNAARQTPDQFAQGQAFINQGMAPAAASIASGITPSAGQILNSQDNQMQIMGRLQEAGQAGQHRDVSAANSLINTALQISKTIADKRYANTNERDHLISSYNAIATLLQSQGVTIKGMKADGSDAGEAVGRLSQWFGGITGSNMPAPTDLPQGQIRGGGGVGAGGTGPRPPGGMY